MHIQNYSADVRVVKHHAPSYDMQLEQRIEGVWATVWTTNEISNDFAYIDMHGRACSLRDELLGVVA